MRVVEMYKVLVRKSEVGFENVTWGHWAALLVVHCRVENVNVAERSGRDDSTALYSEDRSSSRTKE